MNKEKIIRLLEDQLGFAREQNRQQYELIQKQSEQIEDLTRQVKALSRNLESLSKKLLTKETLLEDEKQTKDSLKKLLFNKSEKLTASEPLEKPEKEKLSLKERGNNGSRRKEHFPMEVKLHDIYPEVGGFDHRGKKPLRSEKSIRYEYIPPRFIKHIYQLHYYSHNQSVVYGELPSAPLLNSHYDASFFAGILQMRFIYSLPVERIIKLFAENGFELNKSTAHHLVKRAAEQLDYLREVLHGAILEDQYIHMDESYYTILEIAPKSKTGKASTKGCIWAALAHNLQLVQFFYNTGSAARKVLTNYLKPDYRGAIQSDGASNYKILQTEAYPHTIRLACLQHCKRKFLDIEGNSDADQVVGIMNELYTGQHQIPPDSSPAERLRYKQQYAPPILEKLKHKLLEIKDKKTTLPKSKLAKAVNYTLKEYPALCNYVLAAEYELDNNAIERINRYISLSRRNSLFCGSHRGAERAALIYSLACSCRLHGINTFEYFKDLMQKLIEVTPRTDNKYLRNLLPDRWKKT